MGNSRFNTMSAPICSRSETIDGEDQNLDQNDFDYTKDYTHPISFNRKLLDTTTSAMAKFINIHVALNQVQVHFIQNTLVVLVYQTAYYHTLNGNLTIIIIHFGMVMIQMDKTGILSQP